MSHHRKLFITSADHEIGCEIARMLSSEHMRQRFSIVVGGQDRSAMEDLEREGVKVVEYDPSSREDLQRHFKGCEGMLIIPPVNMHRRRGEMLPTTNEHAEWAKKCGENIVHAAEQAQVKCALLVSVFQSEQAEHGGRGIEDRHELILAAYHKVEQMFNQSRIQSKCMIKNSLILDSFIAFSKNVQQEGMLPMATSEGKFAPIAMRDVCKAVACVLSGKKPRRGHEERQTGIADWIKSFFSEMATWPEEMNASSELIVQAHRKTYHLTGSEQLSGHELVNKASEAVGGKIKLKNVKPDELQRILKESQMMHSGEATLLCEVHCLISKNKLAKTTKDFHELTGREPMKVSEWFQDNSRHFQPQH